MAGEKWMMHFSACLNLTFFTQICKLFDGLMVSRNELSKALLITGLLAGDWIEGLDHPATEFGVALTRTCRFPGGITLIQVAKYLVETSKLEISEF